MTRPSVVVVAIACGLFAVVLAIRQFRGPDPGSLGGSRKDVPALTSGSIPERAGWSARQEGAEPSEAQHGAGVSGATAGGGRSESGAASGAQGEAGRSGGTASTVIAGERRPGGSLGFSGSAPVVREGNSLQVSPLPQSSLRFEKSNRGFDELHDAGMLGGSIHEASKGGGESKDQPKKEDDGPVISASFKQSLEPERGDAPAVAEGVTFDGAGARFSTDSQYVIPNAGGLIGEAGTISFTIQPDWAGGDDTDASLVQFRNPNQWENRIQITKNGQYLRFLFTDNTGVESGAGTLITNWRAGDEHQITATWGDALASLYVDGHLVGQGTYSGQFTPGAGAPLHIGSDFPGGQPGAQATLSNFQLYGRARAPQ